MAADMSVYYANDNASNEPDASSLLAINITMPAQENS